jgi:hypothetical protein
VKVPENEPYALEVTHSRKMFGPITGAPRQDKPAGAVTPSGSN